MPSHADIAYRFNRKYGAAARRKVEELVRKRESKTWKIRDLTSANGVASLGHPKYVKAQARLHHAQAMVRHIRAGATVSVRTNPQLVATRFLKAHKTNRSANQRMKEVLRTRELRQRDLRDLYRDNQIGINNVHLGESRLMRATRVANEMHGIQKAQKARRRKERKIAIAGRRQARDRRIADRRALARTFDRRKK